MNFIEAAVFILFLAIVSVPLAIRLRLPLEIFLVIGSSIISLIPGLPAITINPFVIFQILLPPILFAAAYFTSWRDFKFYIRPITLMAVGLVICTATMVAIVAHYILPGFTWGQSFLLGAIVSPSDISAASSILKKLGAPRRFLVILEGESLINDAMALTIYRFSLTAILLGTFSMTWMISQFVWMVGGGIITGIIIGFVCVFLLQRIKDVQAETTLTFITAYTSYIVGEHIGVSGVICTVTCGIYCGTRLPEFMTSRTRINSKASWNTLIFILNGVAFTLLGFELPEVAKTLGSYSLLTLFFYGGVISVTVILLRIIWVFPAAYIPRKLFPSIEARDPMPPWTYLLAIGWTGMRGVISLAAVLSIPYELRPGIPFPHRELMIFITYCVIIATLVPPGISLPALFRLLRIEESESRMKEEAIARVRVSEGVIDHITDLACREKIPEDILQEFRKQIERKLKVIRTQLEENPYSSLTDEYTSLKKLTLAALKSERDTLLNLRKTGEIHDDVFHLISDELDLEEIRAHTLRL